MIKTLRVALTAAACVMAPWATEAQTGAGPQAAQIRSYLDGLPRLADVQARPGTQSDAADLPIGLSGLRRAGGTFVNTSAELALLKSDAVWPGALIQGATVADNVFSPIPLARAPGRIRVATNFVRQLPSGPIEPLPPAVQSRDLATVGADEVDSARRTMLAALDTSDPTGMTTMTLASAGTLREGMVKLGVAWQGNYPASMDSQLTTKYDESSMLVKFTQVFYTVSFDPDVNLVGPFFAPSVSLADVQRFSSSTNPPLYISEVKYGRVLLLAVTANTSPQELEATFAAAYQGFSGTLPDTYKEKLDKMSIQVLSVGASGFSVSRLPARSGADTFAALKDHVEAGNRYSLANPGAAIAFTMRYVGSKGATGAPYGVAIAQMVTDESPQLVSLTASRVCHAKVSVWDGEGGGWVKTGWEANPGDKVSFTATGKNWSGVYATGSHGPGGWVGWETPKSGQRGFPITNRPPFALIGRFGSGNNKGRDLTGGAGTYSVGTAKDTSSSFYVGESSELMAGGNVNAGQYPGYGDIWLGINDDEPTNGDKKEKFSVEVCITRKAW